MNKQFKDIIDKHKNKPCLVVAHGPSLTDYLDKIQQYKERGFVIIDCNDFYNFHDVTPTYIMFASSENTMLANKKKLNKLNTTVVYADSADLTDKKWIEENITCDYLPYDQRHFDGKKCVVCNSFGCGKNFISNRRTIQEELQIFTGHNTHYGTGDTVTLHMLSLSILLGCNPIYVVGFELDYTKGYAKSKVPLNVPPPSSFTSYTDNLMNDLTIIRDSAKNIGTEVINLNKETTFDILKSGEIE